MEKAIYEVVCLNSERERYSIFPVIVEHPRAEDVIAEANRTLGARLFAKVDIQNKIKESLRRLAGTVKSISCCLLKRINSNEQAHNICICREVAAFMKSIHAYDGIAFFVLARFC